MSNPRNRDGLEDTIKIFAFFFLLFLICKALG